MKFGENFFQTKLLSHLSDRVCRLLSSPVLLPKFTSDYAQGDWEGSSIAIPKLATFLFLQRTLIIIITIITIIIIIIIIIIISYSFFFFNTPTPHKKLVAKK